MEPMAIKPLDETTIRHIIREADGNMTDGANPKTVIVNAVLAHMASSYAPLIKAEVEDKTAMARMLGEPPGELAIDGVGTVNAGADNLDAECYRCAQELAKAHGPKLAAHNGKWLAKFGIVDSHVKSIGSPSAPGVPDAPPAPTLPVPPGYVPPPVNPTLDDLAPAAPPLPPAIPTAPDLAFLLGDTPTSYAPPPPPPVPDAPAATVAAPSTGGPPMLPGDFNGSAHFQALREALTLDDAELAKRLGISKATINNWMAGRTARVKVTLDQARVIVAVCDSIRGKLAAVADAFSTVQP
jgi:DNA-binding XRE family transcriptional regulator